MNTNGDFVLHTKTSYKRIIGDEMEDILSPRLTNIHKRPTSILNKRSIEKNCPLDQAIDRSSSYFLREQLPDGYWRYELESNVTITAEYVMLFHILGMVDKNRERKMANYLLEKQTNGGFWSIYFGGPGDLSTTIEAYFALKLAGYSADHPVMSKAREFIIAKGGVFKARVFTKIFLALFGEFSWLGVPSIPVELMLLPNWAYINAYELSSWSRSTIIPLSVVMAKCPVHELPSWARVEEGRL